MRAGLLGLSDLDGGGECGERLGGGGEGWGPKGGFAVGMNRQASLECKYLLFIFGENVNRNTRMPYPTILDIASLSHLYIRLHHLWGSAGMAYCFRASHIIAKFSGLGINAI